MVITISTSKTSVKRGEKLSIRVDWSNEVRASASVNLYQGNNNIAWNSTQLREPGIWTDSLEIAIPATAVEEVDQLYGALVDESGVTVWSSPISITVSGIVAAPAAPSAWYMNPLVIGAGILAVVLVVSKRGR